LIVATSFEDLRILKAAEETADAVWRRVVKWDGFARDVVGKQMARATDSIGANIAESFGRYNYGEKLQFLYYARGSLFETKYWLNRTQTRDLMAPVDTQEYRSQLTYIARQLNAFAESLKSQRYDAKTKTVREATAQYNADLSAEFPGPLFDDGELEWLQSPISNLSEEK
jgi:four helix bundle protein